MNNKEMYETLIELKQNIARGVDAAFAAFPEQANEVVATTDALLTVYSGLAMAHLDQLIKSALDRWTADETTPTVSDELQKVMRGIANQQIAYATRRDNSLEL